MHRLLIVDDDPASLSLLETCLAPLGHEIATARSGRAALAEFEAKGADLLLLDVRMPDLDGFDVLLHVREMSKERYVPIVLVTGAVDRESRLRGLQIGADEFVEKPVDPAIVVARVRTLLRLKEAVDDLHTRNRELQEVAAELGQRNRDLETFSYSVSHDLRAPLRAIDGFSQALLEDHAGGLDEKATGYLHRVRAGAQRMGELIDDLLALSRVSRADIGRDQVSLSDVARVVFEEIRGGDPDRKVELVVSDGLTVYADSRLIRVLLENLLGNAWKFTAKTPQARIEVGLLEQESGKAHFVRDNGAGFDMAYVHKLFAPFQRLHREVDFPGTGIGLATVHRIVERHGGRVWAEGAAGLGATVFFEIPASSVTPRRS